MSTTEQPTQTADGYFILPEGTDYKAFRYAGLPLGSVGRHRKSGEIHGHLTTCFCHPEWSHDYELAWRQGDGF